MKLKLLKEIPALAIISLPFIYLACIWNDKYQYMKYIMVGLISFISIFILYSTMHPVQMNPNLITIGIGILFMVLGNYFKTIRPNYFMGIRTPWTLENETVWKDTHQLGGKIWFVGGILIALFSILGSGKIQVAIIFTIVCIMILVPVIYSYFRYREIDKTTAES